jgi:RNA polymerase sigma factor (TIGR02999 family)
VDSSSLLTEQLQHFSDGDREVAEVVLRQILPKLHQIAVRELRRERFVAPLSPTELINEVWLRNLRFGGWTINSREHFYAIAAVAMRRVLIEFARSRRAGRRGGGQIPDSLTDPEFPEPSVDTRLESLIHIGALMDGLDRANREACRIVDMHYFAGFTLEEIADVTGLTLKRVRRRWEKGRDWLKDRI